MQHEDLKFSAHIHDQELILSADGESSSNRASHVRAHLEHCWECRARMAELESTIMSFARTHRQTLDSHLPAIAGPRALLTARMSQQSSKQTPAHSRWHPHFSSLASLFVLCGILVGGGLVGIFAIRTLLTRDGSARLALADQPVKPNHTLTPGTTRPVSMGDMCSMSHEEVVKDVPTDLRAQVFAEYGVASANAGDYEIDYLIAPGLGGTEDIHNLWPEPYHSSVWNARVKDQLEERLHQLVCAHMLDLDTAQKDIATDWIAAYKKYFHTYRPDLRQSAALSERSLNDRRPLNQWNPREWKSLSESG
jgi:hypothetical protein